MTSQRWLLCSCRGERFGLELRWVREIDYRPRVLPLPTAPPPLVGLLHWRGRQVPALSLAQALGHSEAESGAAALMLDISGEPLGLLVESVGETMDVPEGGAVALDQALAAGAGLVAEALPLGTGVVFRLEPERLPVLAAAREALAQGAR